MKAIKKKLRRSDIDSSMPPRWGFSFVCLLLQRCRSSGTMEGRLALLELHGKGWRQMREYNAISVEKTQALYLENRARKNCRGWPAVLKSNGGNCPSGAVFV
jgi:hypothetical protein